MIIDSDIHFENWKSINKKIWRKNEEFSRNDKFIYVDLFHDKIDYLLYSLHVGSIISHVSGIRPIGVTAKTGAVWSSCLDYNPDHVKAVANGYNIDVIHYVDPSHVGSAIRWLTESAARCKLDLHQLEGAVLRSFLRQAKLDDGFPIGRYIHDSYLRTTLKETIETLDQDLVGHAAWCLAFDAAIQKQFLEMPPAWLIVGHVDYSPWGILAHRAIEAGGRIAYFRNEGNLRIHLVNPPMNPDDTLSGHIRRSHSSMMNAHINRLCKTFPNIVDEHFRASASSARFRSHRIVQSPVADLCTDAKRKAQNVLRQHFGLREGRPVIGVFSITFADIPCHDTQAFDDNYQWLRDTLLFAAEHDGIDWLIKIHPADAIYNRTNAAEALQAEFGNYPHIRFLKGDVSPAVVMMTCTAVTTLRGTPGLQAASIGLPVVFAGRGQYSDFGFAYVEETPDAYFQRLIDCANEPSTDSGLALRARAFQFLEDVAFSNVSSLLGPFGELMEAGDCPWARLASRLRWYHPEKDPLYSAIKRAMASSASRVGGDILESLEIDRTAPALMESQRFVTRTRWPEGFVPLTGFHELENWGVWTDGSPLVFLLRMESAFAGALRLEFRLTGKIPSEWARPSIRIVRVDGCEAVPVDGRNVDSYAFETPSGFFGEDGYLLIELESEGGTVPSEVGTWVDRRRLVFSFEEFEYEIIPAIRADSP